VLPIARQDGLLTEAVGDELVVYDSRCHCGHCLNATAAVVWRACDGQTSIPEIAAALGRELNAPISEEIVWLALQRLERAHLLREGIRRPTHVGQLTRREMTRRLACAGVGALLFPVVSTLTAPSAIAQEQCSP
jgi:hypothetical protein